MQGVVQMAIALTEEAEDHIQAAAAWALGQIGRHTPEHAKAVAVSNVLPKLLQCYLRADASEDLQTKVLKIYLIESCFLIFMQHLFSYILKMVESFSYILHLYYPHHSQIIFLKLKFGKNNL